MLLFIGGCDRPVIGEIGFVMPPKQHFAPGEQAWIKCPVGLIAKPERDIVCVGYKNWSQNHVRCVTEGTCKGRCNEQNSGNSCYCDATLCNNYPNRCCSDFRESCKYISYIAQYKAKHFKIVNLICRLRH